MAHATVSMARMVKSKIKKMVIIFFSNLADSSLRIYTTCLRKRLMRVRMEIADDWILRASSLQRARTHSIVSL
jgi:hypothetical protein